MTDPLVSPHARRLALPGWLDRRLVLGLLLVLVSVVVGARVLAAADASQQVWVAARDLAPGSTLREGDLVPGRVQLYDTGGSYLLASGPAPLGYVLQRGIGAAELLPRDSLVRPDETGRDAREVSVPVEAGHLPDDLRPGQLVDVYVTAGAGETGGPSGATRLVLRGVPVSLRPEQGGLSSAGASSVVLSVAQDQVAALVAAAQSGGVDLVRVPAGGVLPPLPEAALAGPAGER